MSGFSKAALIVSEGGKQAGINATRMRPWKCDDYACLRVYRNQCGSCQLWSLSLSPQSLLLLLVLGLELEWPHRPNITCHCRVSCGRSCKAADIMFNFKLPCDYESEVVIVDFSLSMVFAHLISASFKDVLSSCRMFIASDNHLRQSCSGWAKNCKQRTPSYVCTYIYTCSLDQI